MACRGRFDRRGRVAFVLALAGPLWACGIDKLVSVPEQTPGSLPAQQSRQLEFTGQPSHTPARASIVPAVRVTVRDGDGGVVAGFAGDITIRIKTNPGGGTLSGTLTQPARNGVATFSDLSIDREGAGYTLTATAPGTASAGSSDFNVTSGIVIILRLASGAGRSPTSWREIP